MWDATSGASIPSFADCRDAVWATASCTMAHAVRGAWPALADGAGLCAVARSAAGGLLVTGDDYGRLRLRHFPCTTRSDAGAQRLYAGGAHASRVSALAWLGAGLDSGVLR